MTPWPAGRQASVSITNSRGLLKLRSIESVMPSNHRILYCPLPGCLLLLGGEGNGTPLQYSCLENPMDGGAWWAAVHGVSGDFWVKRMEARDTVHEAGIKTIPMEKKCKKATWLSEEVLKIAEQRRDEKGTHGDLTSLAPHERLPEILVVPREKTPTGAAARGKP